MRRVAAFAILALAALVCADEEVALDGLLESLEGADDLQEALPVELLELLP